MIIDRDYDNFVTNWTKTETSGTFGVSGGVGTFNPGNTGLDKLGLVRGPITAAAGQTFEIDFNPSSNSSDNYFPLLLKDNSGFGYSGGSGLYVDGGSPNGYAWDQNSASGTNKFTPTTGSFKTAKLTLQAHSPSPTMGMEYDGSIVGPSSTANFGSGSYTNVYTQLNIDSLNGSSGTLDIKNYIVTDDGTYTPPAPTTLSAGTPTDTTIPLTWSDGSIDTVNADGIDIFADDGGGEVLVGTYAVGDEAGDAGDLVPLTPATNYDIVVRAFVTVRGSKHYSADSNSVNATTDGGGSSADAGPDQIITWPTNTATMAATATNATSILWTKVSGPGTVSFDDDSIEDPIATVSLPGTYVLNMHTDDGLGGTDDDTVTLEFNQAPVVDAGPDQVVDDPEDTVTLAGSVSDDGLPATPGSVDILWTQISGPGTAVFVDDTDPETDVSFDATGEYVLQLAADDGDTSSTDTVKITINIPPTCNAGTDQDVLKSAGADLDGTAADTDGLPDPPAALTTTWSKLSGPGDVTFTPDANALDAHADFSLGGVYVLRLSAYDGATTVTDDVTINVDAPPVVDAGPDQKIKDPNATIQLAGSVTDEGFPDPPAAVAALWEQVSGPGTVVFADDRDPATTCTVDQAGIYTLRLTGDDSNQTADDTVELRIGLQDGIPVAFKARAVGRI